MFFFQKKWLFSGYFRQSENGFLVVILERLTGFSTLKKVGNPGFASQSQTKDNLRSTAQAGLPSSVHSLQDGSWLERARRYIVVAVQSAE